MPCQSKHDVLPASAYTSMRWRAFCPAKVHVNVNGSRTFRSKQPGKHNTMPNCLSALRDKDSPSPKTQSVGKYFPSSFLKLIANFFPLQGLASSHLPNPPACSRRRCARTSSSLPHRPRRTIDRPIYTRNDREEVGYAGRARE